MTRPRRSSTPHPGDHLLLPSSKAPLRGRRRTSALGPIPTASRSTPGSRRGPPPRHRQDLRGRRSKSAAWLRRSPSLRRARRPLNRRRTGSPLHLLARRRQCLQSPRCHRFRRRLRETDHQILRLHLRLLRNAHSSFRLACVPPMRNLRLRLRSNPCPRPGRPHRSRTGYTVLRRGTRGCRSYMAQDTRLPMRTGRRHGRPAGSPCPRSKRSRPRTRRLRRSRTSYHPLPPRRRHTTINRQKDIHCDILVYLADPTRIAVWFLVAPRACLQLSRALVPISFGLVKGGQGTREISSSDFPVACSRPLALMRPRPDPRAVSGP